MLIMVFLHAEFISAMKRIQIPTIFRISEKVRKSKKICFLDGKEGK